jgi:hypothetical protein
MHTRSRGDYPIAGRELVAEGADLRVQVLSLAAGQCVPWHYHSEISDSFVCLDGGPWWSRRGRRGTPIGSWRASVARCRLRPRITCTARPTAFLIVQGVGVYDLVAVGG